MRADDLCSAVIDQISEIVGSQTIVDRHKDRANLRDGIKRFELREGVWRDVSNAITLGHAELLQSRRPAIASIKELFVSKPPVAIDNGFASSIELTRAPR